MNVLTKGGQPKAPHTMPYKGVVDESTVKQVAAYVKTLK